MFARSASEHDFACLPDSFNSNACPSDFALSLSSCAGPAVESPAYRDTAKDYGNLVGSLELHDCDGIAFLKAIHKKCYQFCCLGKTVSSSILDLAEFFESTEFVCKNYHASICDLIKMQGISSLQLSTGIELMKLLVVSVTKVIWIQVALFLEGNLASFVSICEDRPNLAWRRHVTRVAVEIAKSFFS